MSARKAAKPKLDPLEAVDEWVRFSYNGPTTKFIRELGDEIARLRLVIVHEADCTEAADNEVMRRGHRIEELQAALWPFAMKGLHGTTVCADDFRRAAEAMPHAPDHAKQP